MLRLAYPLVLLAALAAGRARAQEGGDRYGPRPTPYGAAYAPGPAQRAPAPALRPAAPLLRTLSWPGKADLRPAIVPVGYASAPQPAPAAVFAPTGRLRGVSAYTAPVPALRSATAPVVDTPAPAHSRPSYSRTPHPRSARGSRESPAHASGREVALAPGFDAATGAPVRSGEASTAYGAGAVGAGSARTVGSNLPPGLAAPPSYVPPGPAYGPALAAEARRRAQDAAAATADTLPPPTVGRYGYVGPGRSATPAVVAPSPPAPSAASQAAVTPPRTLSTLGPPRPPTYAKSYVLSARPAPPAPDTSLAPGVVPAGGGGPAPRLADGVRRYSVHREYGMEPDAMPVPPQFFAATPDLSAPETEPAAPRLSKAAVNAARLAAAGG